MLLLSLEWGALCSSAAVCNYRYLFTQWYWPPSQPKFDSVSPRQVQKGSLDTGIITVYEKGEKEI